MPAPAVTMAQILGTFGQPATVTRPFPDTEPIETHVIWLALQTGSYPSGALARRVDGKRVLVLTKGDVPTAPRGTQIVVGEPPEGSDVCRWIVDSPAPADDYPQTFGFDHHRVVVVADLARP